MKALTATQSRQILQVSKPKLYQLIRSGALTAFRIGSQWRITEQSLATFIEKGGEQQ